jgi:hypothetical protein
MITKELLHQLFEYRDGNLYWKNKNNKFAGYVHHTGYFTVDINKKSYRVHRLVFMMHHGFLPQIVDHIDGNKLNNSIENLRKADSNQNNQNSRTPITNKSGIKGVNWHKVTNKWAVQLNINGKKRWFGSYFDIEVAKFVCETMRHKYHKEFANHG